MTEDPYISHETSFLFNLKFQNIAHQMVFEVQGDENLSGIEFTSVSKK